MATRVPIETVRIRPFASVLQPRSILFLVVLSACLGATAAAFYSAIGPLTRRTVFRFCVGAFLLLGVVRPFRHYGTTVELYDDRVVRDPGLPGILIDRVTVRFEDLLFAVRQSPGSATESVTLVYTGGTHTLHLPYVGDGDALATHLAEWVPDPEDRGATAEPNTARWLVFRELLDDPAEPEPAGSERPRVSDGDSADRPPGDTVASTRGDAVDESGGDAVGKAGSPGGGPTYGRSTPTGTGPYDGEVVLSVGTVGDALDVRGSHVDPNLFGEIGTVAGPGDIDRNDFSRYR